VGRSWGAASLWPGSDMSEPNLALAHAAASSPGERMDLLGTWLGWWFAEAAQPRNLNSRLRDGLPESLRALYSNTPNVSTYCRQNYLVREEELTVEDGKLLFAYENQGVYLWGTNPTGEADPPVYGRWDTSEPWALDVPSLSLFLIQFFLFEAAIGARFSASAACLGDAAFRSVLQELTPLEWAAWHWPAFPTTFYLRGGAILVAAPNGDVWSVYVGGKTPADMVFLTDHVGSSWENVQLGGAAG